MAANCSSDEQASDLSFLADVLSKPRNVSCRPTPEEEVKNEIQHYRGEQNVKGGTSGLSWWTTRAESYPILSKVAWNYLCIPATGDENSRPLQYPVCGKNTHPSIEEINQLMFVYNNKDSGIKNTDDRSHPGK